MFNILELHDNPYSKYDRGWIRVWLNSLRWRAVVTEELPATQKQGQTLRRPTSCTHTKYENTQTLGLGCVLLSPTGGLASSYYDKTNTGCCCLRLIPIQ